MSLSDAYLNKNDLINSAIYSKMVLDSGKAINHGNFTADGLLNLCRTYLKQGEISKITPYESDFLKLIKTYENKEKVMKFAEVLASYYSLTKQFDKAYAYEVMFANLSDNIKNQETSKKFAASEYKAKEEKMRADQMERDMIHKEEQVKKESELQRQKTIVYSTIIALLLMLGMLFFIFKSYKEKKKANTVLAEQNELIEKQKNEVEVKQKEIVDSINYAKRIQQTLLAHDNFLQENLNDYFVLFKPKDIVSGDFYWATKKGNKFYIAVCDSTGHGVPGAFMSLLNINFLNEAINEKGIEQPNDVFNYVRQSLIQNISQEGQKDGMDGILLCLEGSKMTYSSANNAPVLVSDKHLKDLSKDKMPVGAGVREDSFQLFDIETNIGDMLYLYTDGFADQFGGPKGKKFKYKTLNDLLVSLSTLPVNDQKAKLAAAFEEWRGEMEQVDDVCIVGIRI